jgi:hypothetical protein
MLTTYVKFDVFPNDRTQKSALRGNDGFLMSSVPSIAPVELNKYLKSFVIGRTTDLMRQSLDLRCIAIMDMSAVVPSVA